jgi:hypothetical protein
MKPTWADDFLKSMEITADGRLVKAVIPSVPTSSPTVSAAYVPPEPPAVVKKFKEKVESLFREMDIIVDAADKTPHWRDKPCFKQEYEEFKGMLQDYLNCIVFNPISPEDARRQEKEAKAKIKIK